MNNSTDQITGASGTGSEFPADVIPGPDTRSVLTEPAADTPKWVNKFGPKLWIYFDLFMSIALWLFSIIVVAVIPAIGALSYVAIRYKGSTNVAQILTSDPNVLLITVIGVIPAHLLTLGAA